ncbi:MAG: hypothetical protein ACLQMF_07125 [Rectinemataceae bacterium]
MIEHGDFNGFIIDRYIAFHKGCGDAAPEACLDQYDHYLKDRIGLPEGAVERSIQVLRKSYPLVKEESDG